MRASGQKLVKLCTLTHTLTHAAKLVVRIIADYSRIGAYRTCTYGKEFPCEQKRGDVS